MKKKLLTTWKKRFLIIGLLTTLLFSQISYVHNAYAAGEANAIQAAGDADVSGPPSSGPGDVDLPNIPVG